MNTFLSPAVISYYLITHFQFEVIPGITVRDNWQSYLINFCHFKEKMMKLQSPWYISILLDIYTTRRLTETSSLVHRIPTSWKKPFTLCNPIWPIMPETTNVNKSMARPNFPLLTHIFMSIIKKDEPHLIQLHDWWFYDYELKVLQYLGNKFTVTTVKNWCITGNTWPSTDQ